MYFTRERDIRDREMQQKGILIAKDREDRQQWWRRAGLPAGFNPAASPALQTSVFLRYLKEAMIAIQPASVLGMVAVAL